MPASPFRLSRLSTMLLWMLASVAAYGPVYPTTTEIDIIFPRNDTYAPVDALPIVLAIRNSSLGGFLDFGFTWFWAIYEAGNDTAPSLDQGVFDPSLFDNTDPQYIASTSTLLNNTEGQFYLYLALGVNNCSIANATADGNYSIDSRFEHYNRTSYFTLRKSAQRPDLVAATGPDSCTSIPNLVFDITGSTPDPGVPPDYHLKCPVLGGVTIPPSPCAVRLDQAKAASISASVTAIACDTWPEDYPGYTAACENKPEGAASILNTVAAGTMVWLALGTALALTRAF